MAITSNKNPNITPEWLEARKHWPNKTIGQQVGLSRRTISHYFAKFGIKKVVARHCTDKERNIVLCLIRKYYNHGQAKKTAEGKGANG